MRHSRIRDAIKAYAQAYGDLQHFQDTDPSIPTGDQKTGAIGEYYVYRHLASVHGEHNLTYGSHSEKGWDIEVGGGDQPMRVQVKTVSAYSTTRTISPIHCGWDELHLVYLSKQLYPLGYWKITDRSLVPVGSQLKSRKCALPHKPGTGSKDIKFGDNLVNLLTECLEQEADT